MADYMSPLVDVREFDATTTIPAVATSIGVIVLRNAYKGPEMKPYFISSTNQLIEVFGKPTNTPACYRDILSAASYLKYGNSLYCTRALAASAQFASATISVSAGLASSGAALEYTLADMTLATAGGGGDVDDFGSIDAVSGFMYITALSRGAWGNNVRIAIAGKAAYEECSDQLADGTIDTTTTATWTTSAAIGRVDSPVESTSDFIIVVQAVDQGYSTVEPSGGPSEGQSNWITKEVFNVSLNPDAFDDSGRRRFVETLINETSSYIRVALNEDTYTSSTDLVVFTPDWLYLTEGIDGDITADDTSIMNAYELYQNPEEIDVNIFIDSDKSDTVKEYIVDTAQNRMDAIAILDPPMEYIVGNRGSESEDLRTYVANTLQINSSYACIYDNWLEVFDKWNGKYRWIPPSGIMAGLFANNDSIADPWFAPAGPNRAIITGVRRLGWNSTKAHRDILYKNNVNSIISLSNVGKMPYGQKTLLRKESAFNRINVRRLFIVLEKAVSTAAKYFLFEPNDDISRLLLVNMIDPFLRDVKARRGIYDYLVVCNETNNTNERIDRGELWCDIYIQPVRAAEFIRLNFIATKTGASFAELTGIAG